LKEYFSAAKNAKCAKLKSQIMFFAIFAFFAAKDIFKAISDSLAA